MARYMTDRVFVDRRGDVHHERKNMMTGEVSQNGQLEEVMRAFMNRIRPDEVAPPHCLRKYKS